MELQKIVITEIPEVVIVNVRAGDIIRIENRRYYGVSFCEDDGYIVYSHRGQEYVSDSSRVIIHPKGESYTLRTLRGGTFFVIQFLCLEDGKDSGEFESVKVRNISVFSNLCRHLRDEILLGDRFHAGRFSIFYGILDELIRARNYPGEEGKLAFAMEYLQKNYQDNLLSIEKVAEEASLSGSYFRKIFKKVYGQSPRRYLMNMRIQKAKEMISSSSDLVVGDVAKTMGFSSTFSFCRAFKDIVGCTATEYAENNKSEGL